MADHHAHPPASTDKHAHAASDHAPGNYWAHVGPYLLVGAALFLFTGITVALSYVDFDHIFHGHGMNIKIGLSVAAFKVGLVGAWFMHLKSEKGNIWRPLTFTFIFVAGLFLLFAFAYSDPIPTTSHVLH